MRPSFLDHVSASRGETQACDRARIVTPDVFTSHYSLDDLDDDPDADPDEDDDVDEDDEDGDEDDDDDEEQETWQVTEGVPFR